MSDCVAAAWAGLRRAAASADGADNRESLADAVRVHAGRLDRAELLRLVRLMTLGAAESYRTVDPLLGSLERVTGASPLARIDAAIDGDVS